jgi:exodeoxyribonuclease VII small subunit
VPNPAKKAAAPAPDQSSAQPPGPPELSALSYEQAREELLEVVRRLETGGTTLEDSLALWERGEALAARCQEWLDGARARLDAASSAGTSTSSAPTESTDPAPR